MKLFARNKKGSLSLSMEAIVILILAVVMLGLGLTFVRGLFSKLSVTVEELEVDPSLITQPSEADTVTITPETIDVNVKETKDIKIGFFNPTISTENWIMEVSDDAGPCGQGSSGNPKCFGQIQTVYVVSPFLLPKDEIKSWRVVFKPDTSAVGTGDSSSIYMLGVKFCGMDDGTEISSCDGATIVHQDQIVMTVRR